VAQADVTPPVQEALDTEDEGGGGTGGVTHSKGHGSGASNGGPSAPKQHLKHTDRSSPKDKKPRDAGVTKKRQNHPTHPEPTHTKKAKPADSKSSASMAKKKGKGKQK
jgi:hypothetical protein